MMMAVPLLLSVDTCEGLPIVCGIWEPCSRRSPLPSTLLGIASSSSSPALVRQYEGYKPTK
jgi:hypothetical protein